MDRLRDLPYIDPKSGGVIHRAVEVMLVDDNEEIRELLGFLLSSEGHNVRSFGTGPEALTALSEGYRPQLILLDWRMPIMSGQEFLENYQALALDNLKSPIYLFTADSNPKNLQSQGFSGYLKKPVDVPALLSLIESVA